MQHREQHLRLGQLMRPQQLAERWGVTTAHLANLRSAGQGIAYLKLGGRVLYRVADILAYEAESYVEPVSA